MENTNNQEVLVQQLTDLIVKHKWVAIAAIGIGVLVRVLKSERAPALVQRIPPSARPIVALALGVVSGVLQKVSEGTPWVTSIVGGLVSAAVSVFGHQVVIEWLRGGKEFLSSSSPVASSESATPAPDGGTRIEKASGEKPDLQAPAPPVTVEITESEVDTPREPRSHE